MVSKRSDGHVQNGTMVSKRSDGRVQNRTAMKNRLGQMYRNRSAADEKGRRAIGKRNVTPLFEVTILS